MRLQLFVVWMAGLALALGVTPTRADIVYNNTVNSLDHLAPLEIEPGNEAGDEITKLDGTARLLARLDIGVAFAEAGTALGVQARIYAGQPELGETPLFESTPMDIAVSADLNVFSFTPALGENVLLPETITWTITATAWPGTPGDQYAELPIYHPPVAGESDGGWYWFRGASGEAWSHIEADEGVASFYALVETVPAPGAAVLGMIGLGLVGGLRRRWP